MQQQQQQQQLGECPSAIIEQGMFNLLFTLLVYVLNMIQVGVIPLLRALGLDYPVVLWLLQYRVEASIDLFRNLLLAQPRYLAV